MPAVMATWPSRLNQPVTQLASGLCLPARRLLQKYRPPEVGYAAQEALEADQAEGTAGGCPPPQQSMRWESSPTFLKVLTTLHKDSHRVSSQSTSNEHGVRIKD